MKIGRGEHRDGIYYLKAFEREFAARTSIEGDGRLWHRRLGYPSNSILPMFSSIIGCNLSLNSSSVCDSCSRAKQTRSVFKINNKRSSELFALIHCDIWGPYRTESLSGAHYFLTIVDDSSRNVWVF